MRKLIREAKKLYPDLDTRGIGPHSLPFSRDLELDTVAGRYQVGTAVAFLHDHVRARKSPDAYGLKHQAESWGRKNGFSPYVSTGAMIVAMIYFKMKVR
jgi:hypothetical protein